MPLGPICIVNRKEVKLEIEILYHKEQLMSYILFSVSFYFLLCSVRCDFATVIYFFAALLHHFVQMAPARVLILGYSFIHRLRSFLVHNFGHEFVRNFLADSLLFLCPYAHRIVSRCG